jgi:VIT1/CCC1 family predicted Fe2+/Mn2+ transporter
VLHSIAQNPTKPSGRVLEPQERISEVLFGLIMVLTFTGSLSVAEAGREDVRTMLVGALGCNLAWGIIDGVLYLMGVLADKGRNLATYRAVRETGDAGAAQRLIAAALPPKIAAVLEPAELESIHQRLQQGEQPPARARLEARDWLGALGVFLLVFLSTFPVAIPFVVMSRAHAALRVSNGIAVTMLFVCGFAFGRITGGSAWVTGLLMVLLGIALVGMTMALGG